jgi:hypothetical protein
MFLFDGVARTIRIDPALIVGTSTAFHASVMYSDWKRWVIDGIGAGYPPAFRVAGGDDIGAGVAAGSYFFLMTADDWKFTPPEINNFQVNIQGNLYADNPVDPIMLAHPAYTTTLIRQLSNTTETVSTSGGGFTVQDRIDLQVARKMLTNRAEVSGDVCTVYDDDKSTVLLRFAVTNNGNLRTPL